MQTLHLTVWHARNTLYTLEESSDRSRLGERYARASKRPSRRLCLFASAAKELVSSSFSCRATALIKFILRVSLAGCSQLAPPTRIHCVGRASRQLASQLHLEADSVAAPSAAQSDSRVGGRGRGRAHLPRPTRSSGALATRLGGRDARGRARRVPPNTAIGASNSVSPVISVAGWPSKSTVCSALLCFALLCFALLWPVAECLYAPRLLHRSRRDLCVQRLRAPNESNPIQSNWIALNRIELSWAHNAHKSARFG